MGISRGNTMPQRGPRRAGERHAAHLRGVGVLLLATLVTGCASTFSSLPPALGGMPADTPPPPPQGGQLAYPAVHDMPPPRQTTVLTPEELKKVEAEMAVAHDRQAKPSAQPAKDE